MSKIAQAILYVVLYIPFIVGIWLIFGIFWLLTLPVWLLIAVAQEDWSFAMCPLLIAYEASDMLDDLYE